MLSVWNAKRLNRFDIKFQDGPHGDINFEEFLIRAEAIAHPGKSSLFKKHRMSSHAPGSCRPVFLWQWWQVAVVLIALAILVLLPILFLAGDTRNFPLLDRFCHLSLAPFKPIPRLRKKARGEVGNLD